MKHVLLVDAHAARVRRFREAVALYRETFLPLRQDAKATHARAREVRARLSGDVRLHVFPNGPEALKFLRREPPYGWAPRPAVVFTDVYLEASTEGTFLQALKGDPGLRDLPTVVLCGGSEPAAVRAAWEAGGNAVVDLRWEGEKGAEAVADVLRFWIVDPPR
ncbi:MAG TPA: hypothetical protein VFV75_18785 [Candidatus Polarisedimenticolaceae bacterium]|nr:hypothetical protein [Candidatus Polarisedimenticolaceae bacterium]